MKFYDKNLKINLNNDLELAILSQFYERAILILN